MLPISLRLRRQLNIIIVFFTLFGCSCSCLSAYQLLALPASSITTTTQLHDIGLYTYVLPTTEPYDGWTADVVFGPLNYYCNSFAEGFVTGVYSRYFDERGIEQLNIDVSHDGSLSQPQNQLTIPDGLTQWQQGVGYYRRDGDFTELLLRDGYGGEVVLRSTVYDVLQIAPDLIFSGPATVPDNPWINVCSNNFWW